MIRIVGADAETGDPAAGARLVEGAPSDFLGLSEGGCDCGEADCKELGELGELGEFHRICLVG
ncbi:MAG: hypothetical protein GVY08_03315 [Bacteroidetes bacterium]|nr:hypothetical protein [Bacteroidota bacterium]